MAGQPKYTLTQADLDSFLAGRESASAIGRRHGVTPSLVTYRLRKLNDPRVKEVLARNSAKAKGEFNDARRDQLDQLILAGKSATEIVITLRVSTNTVTRARRRLGLYVEPKTPRKPKPESTGTVYDLLQNVIGTPVFKLITKPWPVKLEQTTGEAA